MKKHTSKPVAAGSLTQEQLDAELARGVESLKAGKTYTPDEVDAELAKRFGLCHGDYTKERQMEPDVSPDEGIKMMQGFLKNLRRILVTLVVSKAQGRYWVVTFRDTYGIIYVWKNFMI